MKPSNLIFAYLLVAGLAAETVAAPFVISNDISNGTSSVFTSVSGPGVIGSTFVFSPSGAGMGSSQDGGFDAFDFYGEWIGNGAGLSLSRRVDALSASNVYRFLDTFTNFSGAQISRTLSFAGNLGSDSGTVVDHNVQGLVVTHEAHSGLHTNDPVLAHIYGNNAFATANMTAATGGDIGFGASIDNYVMTLSLVLDPGESVSILQFVFADRPDTSTGSYGIAGTNQVGAYVAAAIATGTNILSNPDLSGLSPAQINSIANFGATAAVPEPTSLVLCGIGMIGLAGYGRRRRTA